MQGIFVNFITKIVGSWNVEKVTICTIEGKQLSVHSDVM